VLIRAVVLLVAMADAEAFARKVIAEVPPAKLEELLVAEPRRVPEVLRMLGSSLMTRDPELRRSLEQYLPQLALAHAKRSAPDLRLLGAIQLIDPKRFVEDAEFRARVTKLLPHTLDGTVSLAVRQASVRTLNEVLDFDTAEGLAVAWGCATRSSASRRIAFNAKALRMPDDLSGPIDASVFSINSGFFDRGEARDFLAAVRKAAPKRRIIVLGDAPMKPAMDGLDVTFVDTLGRAYTPWPRDPFSIARTSSGGVVFINRPNEQPDREEDANMVRALIQGMPDAHWTVAPVPFHNGHVLLTPEAAWISIHTVEIRALSLLGLHRVPVETFRTARGIEDYLQAVRRAARELEALYQKPVRFVHPLDASPELMRRLGGGGGFDLDSVVTLLPTANGMTALVGDIQLGANLAAQAGWKRAHAAYGFAGDSTTLGTRVAQAQREARTQSLAAFLDAVAQSLAAQGMNVQRIPLLHIPASMITAGVERDFLLTWNNVVLERNGKELRAEGFASLVDEGDAMAREAFARAGYRLELHPPLIRSIVLSGGYRCASNHLR
jgi:hypothetical protein